MNTNKQMVPELRFKGFTDAWVQRKLADVVSISAGGDVDKTKLIEDGGYPVLANALTNSGIVGYYDSYKVEAPAVTVTGRGDVGHAVARHVNFTPVVRLLSLKSEVLDADFLANMLNQTNILVESTGVPQLTAPQLGSYKILYPNLNEQTKIGKLLNAFDNLIALHQRKLYLLKEQKKGYLQKLFPKNGSRFPELRFAGFTDAWEKRNLGELATFSKGKGYSKGDLVPDGHPIILYGRLYTKYETNIKSVDDTFVVDNADSVKSELGDVIVPGSGETAEDISRASNIEVAGIILGGDLNVVKPSKEMLDSSFLAITISNGSQQKELTRRAQGKSVVHLHNSDLQTVQVRYPSLKEQRKISQTFSSLDNLIAVNQRNVELLKKLKQAYLQKMFV